MTPEERAERLMVSIAMYAGGDLRGILASEIRAAEVAAAEAALNPLDRCADPRTTGAEWWEAYQTARRRRRTRDVLGYLRDAAVLARGGSPWH